MKIGFIGCGNMGEAILVGNYRQYPCMVCEPRAERRAYLKKKFRVSSGALPELVTACDMIILAVKPQDFPPVLSEIALCPLRGKLIVSVAAGITTMSIERVLGRVKVVRAMPNLPAVAGAGVTALCRGRAAALKDLRQALAVFQSVGTCLTVREEMMDAVTAVSGSGPAYVFLVAESMVLAARSLGFAPREAEQLVNGTLTGAARLLAGSAETAAALRARVTSRGGTTQAAMDVFMAKDIHAVFKAAMTAARDRAKELAI